MSSGPDASKLALWAAGGLVPLSLVVFAYERALNPLYASIPSAFLLDKLLFCAILAALANPFHLKESHKCFLAGIVLALTPNATYWLPVWTTRNWKNPYWGPVIVHAIVLVPLAFSFGSLVKSGPTRLWSRFGILYILVAAGSTLSSLTLSRKLWANLDFLRDTSNDQIFLVHALFAICAGIIQFDFASRTKTAKGKKTALASTPSPLLRKGMVLATFLALWLSFPSKLLRSPVLPHPYPPGVQEQKTVSKGPRPPTGLPFKHPSYPMIIHSSVQSTTGLIVVGEALENPDSPVHAVRYLRAAHSILGGVWVGSNVRSLDDDPPMRDARGVPLGDSIYGTFVLQEAARLVNSTGKGTSQEDWKNALIIGLGTGISASAFHRHGMKLTIVEIDPAVYVAARRYFGLPDPGHENVFLQDARGWTAERRIQVEARKDATLYDIVVHDCFSGGGVPEQLYSVEFWNDLKRIVSPNGVVVVNVAGEINSKSSRLVLYTLESVFPRCRAFYDSMDDVPEEKYAEDFTNQVYFCTLSPEPLTFRTPSVRDYVGSLLTRHMLETLPNREVNLDVLRNSYNEDSELSVLSDANNPLGKLQEDQGFGHWLLMRQVLPDVFWETY
ncbi:hypothetical protein K435DRAFT_740343 [Dendrothele bispora CBS 962.96]|uniref:S-adenosyl-L-methionine-dependent methyltransferase n=1 Tax=Dendrothele bispora (strain CBS 962.96) TaxID=1314807 RepID=A0A4S8MYW4_DENBC|nr:hypothetical protein K435DRAFT_740343 [Dendrothele bispora CBS 962.96]